MCMYLYALQCAMHAQVVHQERYILKHCKRLTDCIPLNWQSGWIFFLERLLDLERWICFHCVKDINQHPEEFVLTLCWLRNRRTNCSIRPTRNYIFKNFPACRSPVTMFAYTNMHTVHQTPALLKNSINKCSHSHNPFNVVMSKFDVSRMNLCLSCWKCSQ